MFRAAQSTIKGLNKDFQRKNDDLQTEYNKNVGSIQDWYRLVAIVLPPIPPLVVGFIVFFTRRMREKEGVSRNRLR